MRDSLRTTTIDDFEKYSQQPFNICYYRYLKVEVMTIIMLAAVKSIVTDMNSYVYNLMGVDRTMVVTIIVVRYTCKKKWVKIIRVVINSTFMVVSTI